jgi:acyl-coenzyme A thioesterase PaaI-like protein
MGLIDKLIATDTNLIRDAWDRLSPLPGGRRVFSRMIGIMAPYSGSVGAQVVEVRRDYAKIELADRRRVRNHLTSVHAIALANLAEMTGNLALAYSLPDDARFIVAGMELEYVKKARGTITAECEFPMPRNADRQEVLVPVVMSDRNGEVVTRATLRSLVGPKRQAASPGH